MCWWTKEREKEGKKDMHNVYGEGKRKKDRGAFAVTKQIGRRLSPRIQERQHDIQRTQAERSWPKPLEYEVYPRSPTSSRVGGILLRSRQTRGIPWEPANGPRFFFFRPCVARVVSILRGGPATTSLCLHPPYRKCLFVDLRCFDISFFFCTVYDQQLDNVWVSLSRTKVCVTLHAFLVAIPPLNR